MEFSFSFGKINQILITGNGFDLALGLPTSYPDFMRAAQAAILSSDGCIKLDEVFPKKHDKLINERHALLNKHYAHQESYALREIKDHSKNTWLRYFLWLGQSDNNSDTEKKWVDFEREIHQLLVDVAHLKLEIDRVKSETKSSSYGPVCKGTTTVKTAVVIHETSFNRLAKALSWKQERNRIGNDYLEGVQSIQDPTEIVLYLYEELKAFAELFKIYLSNLVVPIFESRNFDNPTINLVKETTGIITFNYTHIAQQLLEFPQSSIRHLHGEIEGKDGIIFGIDSVNQHIDELGTSLLSVLGTDVLLFTKYFQSLFHRTFAIEFKQPEFHQSHRCHYSFYGHSFDLSDRSYIKVIFDLVLRKNSEQHITIYHHNEKSRASILRNLLDPRMLEANAQEKIERLIAEGRLSFIKRESLLPSS